jgi:hypothetical protein
MTIVLFTRGSWSYFPLKNAMNCDDEYEDQGIYIEENSKRTKKLQK